MPALPSTVSSALLYTTKYFVYVLHAPIPLPHLYEENIACILRKSPLPPELLLARFSPGEQGTGQAIFFADCFKRIVVVRKDIVRRSFLPVCRSIFQIPNFPSQRLSRFRFRFRPRPRPNSTSCTFVLLSITFFKFIAQGLRFGIGSTLIFAYNKVGDRISILKRPPERLPVYKLRKLPSTYSQFSSPN